MRTAYYYTSNAEKAREAEHAFRGSGTVTIMQVSEGVTEILETDLMQVIQAKALEAYASIQLPVIVEHGAFCLDYLNGLPGALIQPFWLSLGGRLCTLTPPGHRKVTVRSAVCYCDGRIRKVFERHVEGELADRERGAGGYHWDPIFIPHGETRTFAEMPMDEKLRRSPAGLAYADMRAWLEKS